MSHPTEKYTEERLPVGDLSIDRRVQRQGLNTAKVERIVANYNPAALGIITVSYRKDRSYVVVDGQHRVEATRRVTDNQGDLPCRVFKELDLAQEAQMFLDLNHTTVPTQIDKFKVRLQADSSEGEAARSIGEIVGAYGWSVSKTAAPSHINAVTVLERMYQLSLKIEADPNLLSVTMMVITRAWGNDRFGAQAPVLEGIARMFGEYGGTLDIDHFIDVLKRLQGGPQTLVAEARQLASLRKWNVAMAVADKLVTEYNKGRRSKGLRSWRDHR